ncbi:Sacchrp-dh-NADP domain-containing protein [Mycena sanguinolenta]|uniref:Sacchrp-dh-NADP domain-containing protein n=1 Tax=Mycena sanguinolenta TaxID=230812 RepID=A0A8H6Y381_9AGAR|nr:Sacchrp-dh-NADP domain-containing protein [Mycena sanguinolenta]
MVSIVCTPLLLSRIFFAEFRADVDITGEIHWIKRIITSCHYAATKSGAIIVPSRGFDAMPSDIVTYIASKTLRGSSGGTVATILSDLDNVSREERRASHKEYSLSPSIGVLAPRRPLVHRLFVPDTSKTLIGSLFFMTQPDRLIVQRSWGLFEVEAAQDKSSVRYGPTFKYDEFLITGSALSAVLLTLSLVIGLRCMLIPPLRWLFKKFLPQPGEGPSESVQNNGFMELTNITTAVPSSPGAAPLQVKSLMNGQGDPGYKLTALFLSEAALCLALAHDALPAIGRRGGVLTPATALGDVLVDRLAATRQVTFESKIVTARTREGKKIV